MDYSKQYALYDILSKELVGTYDTLAEAEKEVENRISKCINFFHTDFVIYSLVG